jgi:hypothetical protein
LKFFFFSLLFSLLPIEVRDASTTALSAYMNFDDTLPILANEINSKRRIAALLNFLLIIYKLMRSNCFHVRLDTVTRNEGKTENTTSRVCSSMSAIGFHSHRNVFEFRQDVP